MHERWFRPDGELACGLLFHQQQAIATSDDDDGSVVLNTNARAIFFLSHTLFFLLLVILVLFLFFVVLILLLFYFHMADIQVRDERRRCRRQSEKERMRVKDDCMSNLRHGDYDYVTFALVLLLHSFFAQPSSNPMRRTRLFFFSVRACMCARVCAYI